MISFKMENAVLVARSKRVAKDKTYCSVGFSQNGTDVITVSCGDELYMKITDSMLYHPVSAVFNYVTGRDFQYLQLVDIGLLPGKQ